MKKYCEHCEKEVETNIVSKRECYPVCGEEIVIDAKVLVCADCGEEFFCEELDEASMLHAFQEYRRRHRLLQPEEIRQIREQYGLSQRRFAKLLNWGDKTIHRYENGAIQDKAHNSLLLFLRDPGNMRLYLTENEVMLEEKQRRKLLDTIDHLEYEKGCRTGEIGKEGWLEVQLSGLKNLMENLSMPLEEAMNALGISESARPKLRKLL